VYAQFPRVSYYEVRGRLLVAETPPAVLSPPVHSAGRVRNARRQRLTTDGRTGNATGQRARLSDLQTACMAMEAAADGTPMSRSSLKRRNPLYFENITGIRDFGVGPAGCLTYTASEVSSAGSCCRAEPRVHWSCIRGSRGAAAATAVGAGVPAIEVRYRTEARGPAAVSELRSRRFPV